MIKNVEWLGRLNRDSKGIWGISNQINSKRGAKCVDETVPQNCESENLFVVSTQDGGKLQLDNGGLLCNRIKTFSDSTLDSAKEFDRTFVRLIIQGFHNASKEFQCALIKESRAIQESSTDIAIQFVFCGHWSYYDFCINYQELHGQTSSPAAEFKNFLYVPEISLKEVKSLLMNERLISSQITEVENVACKYLLESTSGNEFIIDTAIQYLKDNGGSLIENVEKVMEELTVSPEVIDYIKYGIMNLGENSKIELNKLLRVHRLIRDATEPTTELLWLAGLVKFKVLGGLKQEIQIAGPIVNKVIRNVAADVGLDVCSPAQNLCLDTSVISTQVFSKVAEIENLFRSLIVSEWYKESGDLWEKNLDKVRTPAFEKSEKEELINLVLTCVKEQFPQLQTTDNQVKNNEELSPVINRGKKKHESLLASAKDWQARQKDNHSVVLGSNNVMHFLTTEALKSALTNKHVGIGGDNKIFPRKDFLLTTLDEYLPIRSAVAHNQPIMLETLSKLESLLKNITVWISVFIDKETNNV